MTRVSEFLTGLEVVELDDNRARLLAPLTYFDAPTGRVYVVPEGFETDYASVPRVPVVYLLFGGTAKRASVVHDWLYSIHAVPITRREADAVLFRAMRASGKGWLHSACMWAGVRLGGTRHWKNAWV